MIRNRWLQKRKPFWDRLEDIIKRAGRRGLMALSAHELQDMGLLYRQVASDLSTVREDPLSQRLAGYLNQLLGRAHNLIYMGRAPRPRGITRFYRSIFPQVFRETFNYTLAAFGLFLLGTLVGFLATLGDPAFQRFFLGEDMARSIDRRVMWTQSIVTIKPLASSGIMTNNLSVSFSVFATGILGGVGTVCLLLTNGLLFGVISAACWQAGMAKDLLLFVAPHGVIEIPSILIAGAAGLLLARGLLFPGSMTRRDATVFWRESHPAGCGHHSAPRGGRHHRGLCFAISAEGDDQVCSRRALSPAALPLPLRCRTPPEQLTYPPSGSTLSEQSSFFNHQVLVDDAGGDLLRFQVENQRAPFA
jgi:uncharacterized membrane protein SpoIIM required for sporulation